MTEARVITMEAALQAAHAAVARLDPLTEAEAWEAAQDDAYGLLSHAQRDALDRLDELDFLMTGQVRGCHWGRCRTDPHGNPLPVDISWRTS